MAIVERRTIQQGFRNQIKKWNILELKQESIHVAHEWDRQNLVLALRRLWNEGKLYQKSNVTVPEHGGLSGEGGSSSSSSFPVSKSLEVHLEQLLQQKMVTRPSGPATLAELAIGIVQGGAECGHYRTLELLEAHALRLLPQMSPREMTHLAYLASRKPKLKNLMKEIESTALLRLPEFTGRSLCQLAAATRNSQLMVSIVEEMDVRGELLENFEPREIAQAVQAFAYFRESTLEKIEVKVCQAAVSFEAREWATVLWALHDGQRTRAVEHLLESLPSSKRHQNFFQEWKLLELICLFDISGEMKKQEIQNQILKELCNRIPQSWSEVAALLRIGIKFDDRWKAINFGKDYNGLAQVCAHIVPTSSSWSDLEDARKVLIQILDEAIRNGQVEETAVVELGSLDTRILLDSLGISHMNVKNPSATQDFSLLNERTTCKLDRKKIPGHISVQDPDKPENVVDAPVAERSSPSLNTQSHSTTNQMEESGSDTVSSSDNDYEMIQSFTAGRPSGQSPDRLPSKKILQACHLLFDRHHDAEFQALSYIMTEEKALGKNRSEDMERFEYRISVTKVPCMSCIWALWQVHRRGIPVQIAFPDHQKKEQ